MAAERKTLEALSNRLLELDSAIEKRNNSRFREASDSETYEFVESMKNQNTQMKTNSNLKKIHSWRAAKSRKYPLKRIVPVSTPILPGCQEQNNREYEPDTLEAKQASLHRYLAHKQ